MTRLALFLLGLALAACSPGAPGGTLVTGDSALAGAYSRSRVISDHPHHVLLGHVAVIRRGDGVTRALIVAQRRDGVHRLSYREAWQTGHELPWSRLDRTTDGCLAGTCRNRTLGMIALSPAMMDHAARHGLSATLIGRHGAIAIHAPAALFSDAADRDRAR